jgi:alpha-ketoglutarate-dependent taurine dioxygenase
VTHSSIPTLAPLTDHLGYEVRGIDASLPLAPGMKELLRGALATRGLLLFREQTLDEAQQIAFARVFGHISRQGPIQAMSKDATYVSNVRADGTFGDVELHFHSDQAYFEFPMKAIMLYGIEVPERGGETLFASTAAARAAMGEELLARLRSQRVLNRLDYSRVAVANEKLRSMLSSFVAETWHPVLTTHADSGIPIHMVNQDHSARFDNASTEETAALLKEIGAIMTDPQRVYRHRWSKGDLIVWDNTLLHHGRTPFASTERRTLRRCAIGHDQEVAFVPPQRQQVATA